MASYSKSFTLLETPERIWTVLADFPRWDRMMVMPDARRRGWGDRFAVREGAGPGMRLAMINEKRELFQEWRVEEFLPPKRLRLVSEKSYGPGNTHMDSEFVFEVSPVSPSETKVEIRFDAAFSHPFWSLAFFWLPIRHHLRRMVERMERGLVDALSA